MSSIKSPVGPEEPSTYWRRRAAIVVGLLVVLWLAWWLLQTAFGSGGEPAAAEPSPSPSFGLSMSPSDDPSASASPSAGSQPSASPSASPAATAPACADSSIAVAVSTGSASTSVGSGMALTMSVTNTGSEACSRDVGAGANEVTITSGSALVWSSDFCNPSTKKDTQVLDPGKEFTTSVTWPGNVTQQTCPDNQPLAQPGSYRAEARNGKVDSEQVTFTVE